MADGEEPDWETEPFATSSDLEQRWRAFGEMPSEDRELADTLLSDASQIIRDECPRWRETSPLTRKIIACEMVKDVLSQSDDAIGVSQSTETAGSFSQTYQYANPSGRLYLTSAQKRRLLKGRQTMWSVDLATGAAVLQ